MSQAAARRFDRISHAAGGLAALGGGAVGGVVGAIAGAGAIMRARADSGLLAALLSVPNAAAAVFDGAAKGMSLGRAAAQGIQALFGLPDPTTGLLWTGSSRVVVNSRAAIRAGIDKASCHGRWLLDHFPKLAVRVAEGSATVLVEGQPAGRVGDSLECSAKIKTGSDDVVFGGPPAAVLAIAPTNTEWLQGLLANAWFFVDAAVTGALLSALSFVGANAPGLLLLINWGQVEPWSYEDTKRQVLKDLETSDNLQQDIKKFYSDPDPDKEDPHKEDPRKQLEKSKELGYYGSPRHRQFAEIINDMTGGRISVEQAMELQPFGGDTGPGTGVVTEGIIGRHSMIHDVQGFLGRPPISAGPGYGGCWPDNKYSGQAEGIIREALFPTEMELW